MTQDHHHREDEKYKKEHCLPWTEMYSEQMHVRMEKRDKLLAMNSNPYRNDLVPKHRSKDLITRFNALSKEELEALSPKESFVLAGRVLVVRSFGKAAFLAFDDGSMPFQLYVKEGVVDEEGFKHFKLLDYGDVVYTEGEIFKTNKGELALKSSKFFIVTKALRPLPEKFHGLSDPELRYRMRYVDLIMNHQSRDRFKLRSQIIRRIREFFYERDYHEVETPMLHTIVGGAAAKPFMTHHNSLAQDMNMRIAPELHLKRLIVGGMNRVFELNRCFRNEGISFKHNPEFTSLEFYEAYATFDDMLSICETLLSKIVHDLFNTYDISFGEKVISFKPPFKRLSMRDAVRDYLSLTDEDMKDTNKMAEMLKDHVDNPKLLKSLTHDRLMATCFDELVSPQLVQPTFICDYPVDISPLSRRNDKDPSIVDRFELFINGWEIANAFSELNDPIDQLERFAHQARMKDLGDEEACDIDYDFVRALEYGMPPTAGQGIGIDRLCMLLTNSTTIRDVILFPQLKKEHFFHEHHSEVAKTE